jgi:hypothetical protein
MTEEDWKQQFRSFKYGYVLDRSSALGRLGERKSVVLGEVSPSFKASKFERWSVQQDSVFDLFSRMWNQSFKALVVLGNSAETKPWVEREFPGYEIEIIPYKDSLNYSSR